MKHLLILFSKIILILLLTLFILNNDFQSALIPHLPWWYDRRADRSPSPEQIHSQTAILLPEGLKISMQDRT
jgi:hypothetical protein